MKYIDYLNMIAFSKNVSGSSGSSDTPAEEKHYITNANALFSNTYRTDVESITALIPVLKPTTAVSMGSYTGTLPNLDMMKDFDMSQCKDMSNIFKSISNKNINLNTWNTQSVTNLSQAFYLCLSTTIDISSWDISNVTTMANMFYTCSAITTLKLFKGTVKDNCVMTNFFSYCNKLKTVVINTDNVLPVTSFASVSADCKFYVKDELINEYMTANLWIDRADYIYPLSEYVEV